MILGQPLGRLKSDKVDPDGLPAALVAFPYPTYETDDGEFVTDDASQASIVWWFDKRAVAIVIDYEHQTMTGGEAPAAGWINRVVAGREAGLILDELEWTPRAAAYLQGDEYRYHSPVYYYDKRTRRIFRLHSLALTNSPKSHNQRQLIDQVAAKAMGEYEIEYAKTVAAIGAAAANGNEKGGTATMATTRLKEELLERFRYLTETRMTETYKVMKQRAQALVDLIPDTDDLIAAAESADKAEATLLDLLGVEDSAIVADSTILAALELDPETATAAQAVAKILSLMDTDEATQVAALKEQLASAKSELTKFQKEQITPEQAFERKLAAAKGIPPARAQRLRALAKAHGFEAASAVIDEMPNERPPRVAGPETAPPEHEITVATTRVVGSEEYEISEDSAAKCASVEAWMLAHPEVKDFSVAADKWLDEQSALARRA